jgi:predicted O-methyltransferase YrrM
MSSLTEYYAINNIAMNEGYIHQHPDHNRLLTALITEQPDTKSILEIGFNGGHSSETFLRLVPNCKVLSFDLGEHAYVYYGKRYLDQLYPERHTLIIGDSRTTVPNYLTSQKFDIIFIDGGHDYDVARMDIANCMRFAHEDTLLIVDDTVYTPAWQAFYTVGPTRAFSEAVQRNMIIDYGYQDVCPGRGMSWGYYNLWNLPPRAVPSAPPPPPPPPPPQHSPSSTSPTDECL